MLLGLLNILLIEFVEKLIEIMLSNLRKVFYFDIGSVFVEIVIKMVYQYWKNIDREKYVKKNKFIMLNYGYYGDMIGVVSVGGIKIFYKIFKDLIFENI